VANKPKKSQKVDTKKVSKVDICQTPPHAIEPLLPYLKKEWWIWESAAGPEKILANALGKQGYIVHATDLLYDEKYNYFTYNPAFHYDIEITNMPFSIKYAWLKKAFERGRRFCLIAPYETTFAKEFQKLFKQYNGYPAPDGNPYYGRWFIEVLSPERRIAFKMPDMGWGKYVYNEKTQSMQWRDSSAQMPTCWITWGLQIDKVLQSNTEYLRTYYVPMRSTKYDKNNQEIKK